MTKRQETRINFILRAMGAIPALGYIGDYGKVEVFVDPTFAKAFIFAETAQKLRSA